MSRLVSFSSVPFVIFASSFRSVLHMEEEGKEVRKCYRPIEAAADMLGGGERDEKSNRTIARDGV